MFKKITKILLDYVFIKLMTYSNINEYDDNYDPKLNISDEINENNTITVKATFPHEHGKVKSDISHNVYMHYYVSDKTLSQINIDVLNIKYADGSPIFDYIFNFIKTTIDAIDEGIYNNSKMNDITISENLKLVFKFSKENDSQIYVKALFMSDIPMNANIKYDKSILTEINTYSKELGTATKKFLDKANDNAVGSELDDLFQIDVTKFNKDFKIKKPKTNRELLTNTIIAQISRLGNATVSDILTVYEGMKKVEVIGVDFNVEL